MPTYERWYGEHGAPELFGEAVYGLAELYRDELRGARLVAVPGCYPTASVLGLAPLAERGLLTDVVVSAMQGTSGYGRSSDDLVHFSAMTENAFPYKTEGHRHRPEIEQELAACGSAAPVAFVPHLLPLDQGELTTCFAQLAEPLDREAVQALYRERYADEPFVRVLDGPPNLRAVRDTNECHVYVTVEERGRVLAFSAIDNIWKGASSQAIQCLNLMLGFEETEGLDVSEPSSSRAGWTRRPGSSSSTPRCSRPAFAPAPRTAASRAAARPTSACSSATRPRSAPRCC